MKNNPLVSIIVPVYNTEKYLRKCLDSILGQSYQNLEIILVDDGSTDKSGDIIDEYQKKDGRVVTIHKKNGGQSSARNLGIKNASGEFIGFVDSDDEIAEDFVSNLMELTDKNTLAATGMHYRKLNNKTANDVYINSVRKKDKNESLGKYVTYLLTIDGRMYGVVNKLFCTEIVKNNDIEFEEKRDFAEDTKFVLDYLAAAKPEIKFVPKALYIYNSGTDTSTVKKSGTIWNNWLASYDDLKKFVGEKPTMAEKFWLRVVLARWRVSYLRNKKRAKH